MKKINTIADLKIDITINKWSFNGFKKFICDDFDTSVSFVSGQNTKPEFLNLDLIENFERKIINKTYKIKVPIMDKDLNQFIETIEIKSNNLTLGKFIYTICKEIFKKQEEYGDWHMFLEGFKKIDDSTYGVLLGS